MAVVVVVNPKSKKMTSEKLSEALKERIKQIDVEIGVLTQEKNSLEKFLNIEKEDEEIKHTYQYWYKNRFNSEAGFSTIKENGFRILYHLQDEGPNFITNDKGEARIWPTIKEARAYIKAGQVSLNYSCNYTIIASDGEIVS